MNKILCSLLSILFFFGPATLAQQSQPAQSPASPPQSPSLNPTDPNENDEGVVKIGTSLVQVDAVVTDRDGKIVRDLKTEDFEIFENGKKQEITNFSFVAIDAPNGPPTQTEKGLFSTGRKLRPEEVKRTTVIVVDDLSIAPGEIEFVRRALFNFVEKQMGPNDLVSIIRTSSGSGALQQLTNNREFLKAGIKRIYPRFAGRDFNQNFFGSYSILGNTIRSLQKLPGRKSIILVSDGLSLTEGFFPVGGIQLESTNDARLDRFRQLVDLANRSSVVINTLHSQGLRTLNYDAATGPQYRFDSLGNQIPYRINQPSEDIVNSRRTSNESQDGLLALARETGGIPIRNTNDFKGGFEKILNDQSGYYLIGYSPDDEIFKPEKSGYRSFRKIEVKVKKAGLTVRSRKGFRAITDEELAKAETPEGRLIETLASPFLASDLKVRLTSLFLNEPGPDGKQNGLVRCLLYYEGERLSFRDDGDGWQKAEVGLYALMFDDNGGIVENIGRTQTLRFRGKTLEIAKKNGFVFSIDVPLRKTGVFQIKAAVCDNATRKLGSAYQYLEIPKLEKERLAVSGLVMSGLESKAAPNSSPQLILSENPNAGPAVREFVRGGGLSLACFAYNPTVHPQTKQPAVTAQIKLYRDGTEVFAGKEFLLPVTSGGRLELSRAISLADSMELGDYTAVVILTDLYQTDPKRKTVTQSLDFTLVDSQPTTK
jgi:VWFA-related protein